MDILSTATDRDNSPAGHILVVDDEPFTVDAVCSLLRLQGYAATGTHSGQEAQQILLASLAAGRLAVDLVMLDHTMPEPDGLAVCRWIKHHPDLNHIPVLMLTGRAAIDDRVRGLDTGADDYVTKPYHSDELLARIRALIRTHRLEQALRQSNLQLATLFDDLQSAYTQVEYSRQQLQQTASTLQALFDGITDGLYIIDQQWRLVAINQGRAEQAATSPEQLAHRPCYQALYSRQSPCPGCRAGATLSNSQGEHWVERYRSQDGLFTEWELSTYPIKGNQGQVSQTIILRREVTEQRRLEATLARAEKLAAVGQLAAGVAHEINNPLTAIIANAQFLTEDLPADEEPYQSAQLIARAGERAARVVRRLLDFARQEELEHQPMDVNASLRESLTLLEPQLAAVDVEVTLFLTPDLPPINASADHIQGIWLNLLINAKDALQSRPSQRLIQIRSRRHSRFVEVSITDNGPGIPANQLAHIFHPFFTTKEPGKGTGLGLSISYLTAEQHGGRIDVISAPGQGTTFTVKLPICE